MFMYNWHVWVKKLEQTEAFSFQTFPKHIENMLEMQRKIKSPQKPSLGWEQQNKRKNTGKGKGWGGHR